MQSRRATTALLSALSSDYHHGKSCTECPQLFSQWIQYHTIRSRTRVDSRSVVPRVGGLTVSNMVPWLKRFSLCGRLLVFGALIILFNIFQVLLLDLGNVTSWWLILIVPLSVWIIFHLLLLFWIYQVVYKYQLVSPGRQTSMSSLHGIIYDY